MCKIGDNFPKGALNWNLAKKLIKKERERERERESVYKKKRARMIN